MIEFREIEDDFRDLVADAVTADDEVFGVVIVRVVHGMRLRVMLPGRV